MNKIEMLEKQLAEMQKQLDEMKKQSAESKELPSMLPPLEEGNVGYFIDHNFKVDGITYCDESDIDFFPTPELAEAYADAFKVIIELRRQPFSGDYNGMCDAYYIESDGVVSRSDCWNVACFAICPPFPSYEACEAAVKAVGEGRILAAYRLLANVKG